MIAWHIGRRWGGFVLGLAAILPLSHAVATAAQRREPVLLAQGEASGAQRHSVALWALGDQAFVMGSGFEGGGQRLTVGVALRLLADRRLAFLWPAITNWAGPDLARLRDRSIAAARAASLAADADPHPMNTGEAMATGGVRATLQYADALAEGGRLAEAIHLLRRSRRAPAAGNVLQQSNFVSLTLRMASLSQLRNRDLESALQILDEGRRAVDPAFVINMDINRAAMLATAGRHAEALALIDTARSQFEKQLQWDETVEIAPVPGSLRQFAGIRACALQGLGRHDEARAAFSQVVSAPESGDSSYALMTNAAIRLRSRICMRDVEGVVDEFVGQLDSGQMGQPVFSWVQPGNAHPGVDRDFVDAVRTNPRLAAAASNRIRTLPPEFIPALNHWWTPPPVR
ncbi:MAG TPA: tetratricopeptide repeat protein [Allosphingosinicella sp.]|jgi:tetratricopeptide (TPR) repeat protein